MEKQSITTYQVFNEDRFTKVDMIKTRKSVAFMLNFLPGQQMKAHSHPDKEVYLLVIEGAGTFSVDDKEVEVKKDDVIRCSAEEMLGFINTSDSKVSIYATMTKVC